MKPLLDRYIRSLKERDDHPEQRNDLGAVVGWVLEREGFTVLERAFKHAAHERRVSKGRVQFGIDILALREEKGAIVSFRFVLKRGDITKWTAGEDGSMASDLWLSAQEQGREERYGVKPDRIKVVAVHNGDRDSEGLGTVIEGALAQMRARTGVETEWWDAGRLVEKVEAALLGPYGADASFFPPALQPFVRLTLDSLLPERGADASGFDYAALDLLITRRLALDPSEGGSVRGAAVDSWEELHRRTAELALIVWMVRSECDRVGSGNTLPTLDSIERILSGVLAAVGKRHVAPSLPTPLREDLHTLLFLYTAAAERLLGRLDALLDVDAGLSAPILGEPVQYPLRALRLSGYLAVAGLVAAAADDTRTARGFADALSRLWRTNEGACLNPITDDQLIEIVLAWELWAKVGAAEELGRTAAALVERLALCRLVGLPLPGIWQRAHVPTRAEDIAVLVESRLLPRDAWPTAFSDGASTIVAAALYVARRSGATVGSDVLGAFAARDGREAVFLEVWMPPSDAGERWYRERIEHDGTMYVLHFDCPDPEYVSMFQRGARAIAPSVASRYGVNVVDRMAWKVGRTPPPMKLVIDMFPNQEPSPTMSPGAPASAAASS